MQTNHRCFFKCLLFLSLTAFLLVSAHRIILSAKSVSKKAVSTQKYNFELNELTIEATVVSASVVFFPVFYLLFNHFLSVLTVNFIVESKIRYKNKFFFITYIFIFNMQVIWLSIVKIFL